MTAWSSFDLMSPWSANERAAILARLDMRAEIYVVRLSGQQAARELRDQGVVTIDVVRDNGPGAIYRVRRAERRLSLIDGGAA